MTSRRFILLNARLVRVHTPPSGKVTFLTVVTQDREFPDYTDVTCFKGVDLTAVTEGASVTIKGDIGSSQAPKDGKFSRYTSPYQFVARTVEAGDEALTPAVPVAKPKQDALAPAIDDNVPF